MMFQRFVLLGLELKNVFLADLRGIRAGILAGVLIHATKHCDYGTKTHKGIFLWNFVRHVGVVINCC
jgi:hypothetical protein